MSAFLRRFLRLEAASGGLVIVAAVIATAWANLAGGYWKFWDTKLGISAGSYTSHTDLEHLIGDIAMSAFFLLVGLEVRREMITGHLKERSARIAPLIAAIAGTALPATIYLAVASPAERAGWPIPTATDIALVVGVFALLARRLHPAARVLLLSIAVIDDVIGIALLALLSTSTINLAPLVTAITLTGATAWLGRRRELGVTVLLVLWVSLLGLLFSAGLHPTLSGVLVALVASPERDDRPQPSVGARLESALHPWVAFAILPLFVLSHAGVRFAAADRTSVATALALFVGKPVAVISALWVGARLKAFALPTGFAFGDLMVIGTLCGAGLTVSSLLASAALEQPGPAILGALIGSALSLITATVIALSLPRRDD